MKKFFLLLSSLFLLSASPNEIKNNIFQKLYQIDNISFNFEQNINGKKESGNCTLQYPKKIFCKYNLSNEKILVSNGKLLVIKTLNSYYLYPIKKTPLHYILDKQFILEKIMKSNERIIDNKYINFSFFENENEINIFFDMNNYELIGWQTLDIFQNLSITHIDIININNKIKKNLFIIPSQN